MVVAKYHTISGTITQMNRLIEGISGAVDAELSHIADEIVSEAQQNARKRTGRMAAMTGKEPFKKGNGIGYKIEGKAPYTIYQHEGTRYIQGDPYILNAWKNHINEIVPAVQKVLNKK